MRAVSKTFGVLALVLAGIFANAQNLHQLNITVPFSFTAAGKTFPAGDYQVFFNPMNAVVTLRGEGSNAAFLMTAPTNPSQGDASFLRFYALGEKRILQDVSINGSVRRLPSARSKHLLISGPVQSEPQTAGADPSASVVTVNAEGWQN